METPIAEASVPQPGLNLVCTHFLIQPIGLVGWRPVAQSEIMAAFGFSAACAGTLLMCNHASLPCDLKHPFSGDFNRTGSAVRAALGHCLPASKADILRLGRTARGRTRCAFGFALVGLSQPRSERNIGLAYRLPKLTRDPLGNRRNRPAPGRGGFGQLRGECSHQAAVAVPLLEKPLSPERLPRDPVNQIGINLGSYWLHEITGQAVARGCVHMQNAKAGV
jgi:hypothetical protein